MNTNVSTAIVTESPIWFITGCSTGFGLELAKHAIDNVLPEMRKRRSGFRTDWAGRSANESEHQIDDYVSAAGKVRIKVRAAFGNQPGDPIRAVTAIIKAVASGKPPEHLLLGNDAFEGAMAKIKELKTAFEAGESVAREADFPKSE